MLVHKKYKNKCAKLLLLHFLFAPTKRGVCIVMFIAAHPVSTGVQSIYIEIVCYISNVASDFSLFSLCTSWTHFNSH